MVKPSDLGVPNVDGGIFAGHVPALTSGGGVKFPNHTLLVTAIAGIFPALTYAAFTDVTGLDGGGWKVDYQYHVTNGSDLNNNGITYDTNNAAAINGAGNAITRVAYYMELSGSGNPNDTNGFIFVSFDTISSDASKLGIPNTGSGEFYQQNVSNMNVYSNVPSVQTGLGLAGGSLEFWPSNYGPNNDAGVPGADSGLFDFGDGGANTGAGFGSMQIANHALSSPDLYTGGTGQTIFAYNQWGGGGSDLGIGNQSQLTGSYAFGGPNPDWTFDSNGGNFTTKDIQVLVQTVPEPASFTALGIGAAGLLARRRRAR